MRTYFIFSKHRYSASELLEKIKSPLFSTATPESVILCEQGSFTFSVFFYSQHGQMIELWPSLYIFLPVDFEYLKGSGKDEFRPGDSIGRFVSIPTSEKYYFHVSSVIGRDKVWKYLRTTRDYHYLRSLYPSKDFIGSLQEPHRANEILNSRRSRYFNLKGFNEFANLVDHRRSRKLSSSLETSFNLNGMTPRRTEVKIDFAETGVVSSRIHAVIGKNGVGKSQCLKALARLSLKELTHRKVIAVNLLKSINKAASPDFVSLKIDASNRIGLNIAIRSLLENQIDGYFFDSINTLRNLLKRQLNCFDIRLSNYGESEISLWKANPSFINKDTSLKFINKSGRPFILSQGQQYLFGTVLMLLLHLEKNSLVLFDEPDTYLHPNYIVDLVKIFEDLLKKTDSYLVVSTHSIFIPRELPKSSVSILFEDDHEVSQIRPSRETLGASLDRLAREFFFDSDVKKVFERFKKKNISRKDALKFPADIATKLLSHD